MQQEARLFGLEINWNKTKIQHTDNQLSNPVPTTSKVDDNDVEIVNTFIYLGCELNILGVGESEIFAPNRDRKNMHHICEP